MDFIAAFFELLGIWLVGNKRRIAFISLILCNITWAIVAIQHHLYGLLITVIIAFTLNIVNFHKWKKK